MWDHTKANTDTVCASPVSLKPCGLLCYRRVPPANKVLLSPPANLQSLLEREWGERVTRITDTLLESTNLHLLTELLRKAFLFFTYCYINEQTTTKCPIFPLCCKQRQVCSVMQPTWLYAHRMWIMSGIVKYQLLIRFCLGMRHDGAIKDIWAG